MSAWRLALKRSFILSISSRWEEKKPVEKNHSNARTYDQIQLVYAAIFREFQEKECTFLIRIGRLVYYGVFLNKDRCSAFSIYD
jgi:hypothetical protein